MTPAEVVAASDITLAMLSDPEACLAVAMGALLGGLPRGGLPCSPLLLLGKAAVASELEPHTDPPTCCLPARLPAGPNGVASAMAPGKGYVDVSTVDAATAQQVAAAVRGAGAAFLEAPVSGSKGPAEQGQLIFLTAGDLGWGGAGAVVGGRVLGVLRLLLRWSHGCRCCCLAAPHPTAPHRTLTLLNPAGDQQLYEAAGPLLEVMGKASFFLGGCWRVPAGGQGAGRAGTELQQGPALQPARASCAPRPPPPPCRRRGGRRRQHEAGSELCDGLHDGQLC